MGEAIRRLEYVSPSQINRNAKPKKMQVAVDRKANRLRTLNVARIKKSVLNFVKIFAFIGTFIGTIGLIIMLLVGYNNLSSINNEIQNINSDIKELQAERDYLTLKLEPYKDPERIEKLAEERLHMFRPEANQVATVTIVDNFETIMANKKTDSDKNVAENGEESSEAQKAATAIGKVFDIIFR